MLLPALAWGQPAAELLGIGTVIELKRNGETIQRVIVGLPTSKILTQDPAFAKRILSRWQFISLPPRGENVHCFMRGDHPRTTEGIAIGYRLKSDLPVSDILIEMPETGYAAAPALGDSLYFLHADPRTKLVDGVQLIQEDSREWGPVHAREFLRIVAPAP